MPSILLIEKLGSIKSVNIKSFSEEEIYKKAGLKTKEGFKCQTQWNLEIDSTKYSIHLYGKTTGRANQENKYEFPPPVDKVLFFGSCILVNKSECKTGCDDLSVKEWEQIYEKLYGGFDDIGDEDSEEDDEEDTDDELKLTKVGYLKDGFVVDEDEEEEEDEEEDDEMDEDDDDDIPQKKSKPLKTVPKKNAKKTKKNADLLPMNPPEDIYLDCASELSEESYV